MNYRCPMAKEILVRLFFFSSSEIEFPKPSAGHRDAPKGIPFLFVCTWFIASTNAYNLAALATNIPRASSSATAIFSCQVFFYMCRIFFSCYLLLEFVPLISLPVHTSPCFHFTMLLVCILPYSSFVFYHNPHFHFTIFVICILTYSSFVFYHIPHLYFNIFLICILPYSSFVFYHILHLYFTIFLICILPYSSFVFYHIRHLYSTIFLICNSTYSSFVFYHIPHFHIPSHPLLTLPFSMLFIQCRSCSHSGPAGTAGET